MPQKVDTGFDTSVLNREDETVALIRVNADSDHPTWTRFLPIQLKRCDAKVEYVMTVDRTNVHLLQWNGTELSGPIVELKTNDVLRDYEPDISTRRVYYDYLVTLVEAWLRDMAYHWNSKNPAGSEELRKVGFLDKIDEGTTLRLRE